MEENVEKTAQKVIRRILKKCTDGNEYIFRGENSQLWNVSSNLYRMLNKISTNQFSVKDIRPYEQYFVESAMRHFSKNVSAVEILTKIQHFGGVTNLIDFTHNYLVALYFACTGSSKITDNRKLQKENGAGQVILLQYDPYKVRDDIEYPNSQKSEIENLFEISDDNYYPDNNEQYVIIESISKDPRPIFQSSIFVHHRCGFFNKEYFTDKTVKINSEEKIACIKYLKQYHGIDENTIYNDIHGFIQNQEKDSNIELYLGFQELRS